MQRLDRRTFMALTGATAASALVKPAMAAITQARVFTADDYGALVDSVVLVGDKKAVLIDAQFTVPNATALADMIAATGRELETIYITHFHPDHLFGLDVLMKRFPNAKPLTHAAIRPMIEQTAAAILTDRRALMGELMPDRAVIPDVLLGDHIMLEGERINILDPMHGDTALITPVHIPSLDTLVGSDILFVDAHLWMAENPTDADLDKWRDSVKSLKALNVGTIIPGHRTPDSVDTQTFDFTLRYLDIWQAARAEAANAADLRAAIVAKTGEIGLGFALDMSIGSVYPS